MALRFVANLRVRRTVAAGALVVSACGGTAPRRPAPRRDIDLRAETRAISSRVAAGMTLASILAGYHLAADEVANVITAVTSVFDPRKVRANRPFRLEQTLDGVLTAFEYEIDADRFLRISRARSGEVLAADILPISKTVRPAIVQGTITRGTPSLFAAVDAAGGTIELAVALADVFAGEVDFGSELQPGDRFTLLVDKQYRDAETFAGYGPILGAELDNGGRTLRAVRFGGDGAPAYFDERGVSMRRFMLHSPLKFAPVVSSGFSRGRLHPILREVRPHLGVDYKAPAGSPVIAVADGRVVSAGSNGGAGRMIHLRHANGFESEYLHLSSIDVRAGARVRQGDLIGRVGATGLATGPHLDFRVKKNGAFINPLTAARSMPPADPVPDAARARFAADRDRVLAALERHDAARPSAVQGSP